MVSIGEGMACAHNSPISKAVEPATRCAAPCAFRTGVAATDQRADVCPNPVRSGSTSGSPRHSPPALANASPSASGPAHRCDLTFEPDRGLNFFSVARLLMNVMDVPSTR